jgi:hypothetical protein
MIMAKRKRKGYREKKVEVTVVGLGHRVTKPTLRKLAMETPFRIELEREPQNLHDENAIAVSVGERTVEFQGQVGYLRRQVAAEYAPAMDEGLLEIVDGWIMDIDPEAGTADAKITVRT